MSAETINARVARVVRNTTLRVFERARANAANNLIMTGEKDSKSATVDPQRLTMRGGRLMRAIVGARGRGGAGGESGYTQKIEASTGTAMIEWTISVPYAGLHEYGGTVPALSIIMTPRMRSFLWAKYYETREDKWKFAALKRGVTLPARAYPARPYMRPGIEAAKGDLQSILHEEMAKEFAS